MLKQPSQSPLAASKRPRLPTAVCCSWTLCAEVIPLWCAAVARSSQTGSFLRCLCFRYGLGRRVALDVARGLHHLHRRRILHFDIKVRTRANCHGALLCVSMLCTCTTPAFHITKPE